MVTIDLTTVLIGSGVFAVFCVFAMLLYQLVRMFSSSVKELEANTDRNCKYLLFEETMVDKFAAEKGIDLKKEEIFKNELKGTNRKTFRKVVSDELIKRVSSEPKK
jgi:hypothetical protein